MKIFPLSSIFCAALCLFVLTTPARAALQTFSSTLTISSVIEIKPSSISVGDQYILSFVLNDASLETSTDATSASFLNPMANLQLSAAPGNIGSFVPSYLSYSTSFVASEFSDSTIGTFYFNLNSTATVDTTGDGSGTLLVMTLRFDTHQTYDNSGGLGSPLSNFLGTPVSSWSPLMSGMSFLSLEESPSASGSATLDAVPEPSAVALAFFGGGFVWFMRRRRVT